MQWLLVEEPSAEALIAMVQVAAMLPALVLALPSGALADILDRRRMLLGVQVFQACVAVAAGRAHEHRVRRRHLYPAQPGGRRRQAADVYRLLRPDGEGVLRGSGSRACGDSPTVIR